MKTKALARDVFHPLLAAAILLSAGSVFAQGQPAQITICHFPPGNTSNPQIITVAARALPAHTAHGDYAATATTPATRCLLREGGTTENITSPSPATP